MTHSRRNHRFFALGIRVALLTLIAAIAEAGAQDATTLLPRVRSHSSLVSETFKQGAERSPTFRGLIKTIDASDGLVYVDEGLCGHGVRACLDFSVLIAGPYRVLRILVNPRRAVGCGLTEAIGHELQHAIEVLSHPNVRSSSEIHLLFHRIGLPRDFATFETGEAVRVGLAVSREACRRAD